MNPERLQRSQIGLAKLPAVLRAYREGRGLSKRAASALTGVGRWTWAKWEAGAVPSPLYLRRLAELLSLPLAELRDLAGPDRVRGLASVGDQQSHRLAHARLRAGLSAAEFARRLHVSPSLVSKWEAGAKVPERRHFHGMAQVLGMDAGAVGELFGGRVAAGETVAVPSLRAVRERRGLSRPGLARLLEVDPSTVQRWERYGTAPSHRARALVAALHTDLPALARPAVVHGPHPPAGTPLRRLCEQQQLSTQVLASRTGVSLAVLRAWTRGTSRPDWAQARALARALKCPVADVFAAAGLEPPRNLDPSRWTAAQLPAILAELRRWHGWTQKDLARLVGVHVATVRAWEQGRHRPRPAALSRLDERLRTGVRLSTLRLPIAPAGTDES